MIDDEGEARIIYHLIEIECELSNCFSRIRDQTLNNAQKNIEKRELEAILTKCARKMIVLLVAIYRGIDSE